MVLLKEWSYILDIVVQDDPRLVVEGPGHLDLKLVQAGRVDSGEYQCRARSARDSHTADPVRITVMDATTIIGGYLSNMSNN